MKLASVFILVFFPVLAHAIVWAETEIDDPILAGAKCTVHEPGRYDSNIYQLPSKYDMVFWPFTDSKGIWFCKKSGFTAFIGDFSTLHASEVESIKSYLSQNPPKDDSIQSRLILLENIYALRYKDREFENRLLRVLARWHQNLGDIDKANQYRRKALAGITRALEGRMEESQRLEYLYLAANYTRQFGHKERSNQYLLALKQTLKKADQEHLAKLARYISALYPDSIHIKKGGVLDPELPVKSQ